MVLPHLDDFLLEIQSNNYSEETLYNYERDLKVLEDFLNSMGSEFDSITKKTILNYKAYLASQDRKTAEKNKGEVKLSSFSINRQLSALRSYLKYLVHIDYPCPIAPEHVRLIKTVKKHPQIGELHDLIRIIECPTSYEENPLVGLRNRAMLETLFATGMRISELLKIKSTQIDHSGKIFILGKGKKERFVYLTPRALQHIRNYTAKRPNTSEYLFVPLRGNNAGNRDAKVSANYLQERIKRYRETLGINLPISAHSFRHGFATYLAESGANPAAIQILLGHESLNTTTRYVQASDRYAEDTHRKYHPLKDKE